MENIMLIEDSPSMREAVESYLKLNDYSVVTCKSCQEAREYLEQESPDLAIIDVSLPDGNGFFLAKEIFQQTSIPFLFLTSHKEESDRILGLELGASDYVVKPFSLKELIMRIQAILRRSTIDNPGGPPQNWYYEKDVLRIDLKSHRLKVNSEDVKLTAIEWEILINLVNHNGAILSRDQIRKSLWHLTQDQSPKTIDSHIKNIRNKLNNTEWIEAIRSFGFRFNGERHSA